MKPVDTTPWLHIRSQCTYHAEAEIAGTRDGLVALRDAVIAAIEHGEGEAQAYASDGEGYSVFARRSSTVRGIGEPFYLNVAAREIAWLEADFLAKAERHNRNVLARIKAEQASAGEAQRAETVEQGSVHEHATAKPGRPQHPPRLTIND